MMPKFAKDQANEIMFRLDRLAHTIRAQHQAWGIPFEVAKPIVNAIDATADEVEIAAFGKESFLARQAEFLKEIQAKKAAGQPNGGSQRQAEVVHREPDEPYMETFKNIMQPVQTEADEPYMKAYGMPDQSSAVLHGDSTTGRPLTPHKNDTPSPV